MATTREEIELLLKTIGAQGVVDLGNKVEELNADVGHLNAAFAQGTITQDDYDEALKETAAAAKSLGTLHNQLVAAQDREAKAVARAADEAVKAAQKRKLAAFDAAIANEEAAIRAEAATARRAAAAEKAAQREADAAARAASAAERSSGRQVAASRQTAQGFGRMQQGLTAASYAFQDFTATSGNLGQKLNSISNNIPGILTMIPGLGQFAIAGSVAATAAIALYQNWGSVLQLFGAGHEIPKAAGDLDGLQESLEKVKHEIAELQKQGYLSTAQFDKYKELQGTERELKEAVKAGETVKRLKELKTKKEDETVKAFEESLKEGGSKKELDALQKDFASSPNPAMKKAFTTVLNSLEKGNIEAYDSLIDLLEGKAGKDGTKFIKELKKNRPFTVEPDINPFEEAAHEAKVKNEQASRELGKKLTKQGVDEQAEFIGDLADETRKGVKEGIGKRLEEILIRTRAAGSKGAKEMAYLTQAIADEMKKLNPLLAEFPTVFAGVARELARTVQQSVDDTIKELMEVEGLTKREALRRLNQHQAEKQQGKTEALAADEFTQFARRQAAQQARFNPGMPVPTPQQNREAGGQVQDQLRQLGVAPGEMVRIGRLLNNPAAQRAIPGAMDALGRRGFGEAEAVRALPEMFRQLQKGAGGFEQAAERILHAAEQAQRAAFNQAVREAGQVPRRAGREAVAHPNGFRSVAPQAAGGGQAADVLGRIAPALQQQAGANAQELGVLGQAVNAIVTLNNENARMQAQLQQMGGMLGQVNQDVAARAAGQRQRGRGG